jgi:hypothetical protein
MAYTTIDNPFKHFNTVTYSGNGSGTQAITGVGYQPDWVWIKSRSNTENHMLSDVVRGSTKRLRSDTTDAEDDLGSNGIQSFDTDGFTAGDGDAMNASGQTYVAWNWLGGGSASSNSDGSITSSVSANTTAGFSIVSYTGTGSNATVGHGLGAAPKVLILKSRTRSDGQWSVGSDMLGWTKFLYLDANSAEQTFNIYQDTAPTSSVFSLSSDGGVNQSGGNMIGYAFAEKKGYSRFGSYSGNGNADGTFVYTGFKPAWVLIKRSDSSENWVLFDNKLRPANNVGNNFMYADLSNAQDTSADFDMLSNGFKTRTTSNIMNGSGASYIYLAFAENPFVTAGTKAAGTAR